MAGRPRTTIGTFGQFTFVTATNGNVKARARFRDDDGQLRLVQATGVSRTAAERALKAKLAKRNSHVSGAGGLSPDSSFEALASEFHQRPGDTGAESTEVPVLLGILVLATVQEAPAERHSVGEA